jgi:hypothetical protein
MIIELKKDLCKNKTIEYVKYEERSMRIQFMKHLQHYKKNLRMRKRLIKKIYRNSRIEDSRIVNSRIHFVYVTKSISSKTVII